RRGGGNACRGGRRRCSWIGLLSGVANDWAGHAVAAAAATAELGARDRPDLDAGLLHLPDRRLVPLVADHHTGAERDDVVAVVPLLALGLELVPACRNDLQVFDSELLAKDVQERALGDLRLDAPIAVRGEQDREDRVDDRL